MKPPCFFSVVPAQEGRDSPHFAVDFRGESVYSNIGI